LKFDNIPAAYADVSANVNGPAIYSAFLLYCSLQVVTPGVSSTATYKLQASNDKGNPQSNFVPTNWFDIPSATVTISGSGVKAIPKTDICYNWIRVVQTGGGTGAATSNLFAVGA
jgi:hypothetical protein